MEFKLEDYELDKFEKWKNKQLLKNNSNHSVNDGRFSFIFTKTSVCNLVEVLDNETNEKILLTDIDF
jgi:hypothetical protein